MSDSKDNSHFAIARLHPESQRLEIQGAWTVERRNLKKLGNPWPGISCGSSQGLHSYITVTVQAQEHAARGMGNLHLPP